MTGPTAQLVSMTCYGNAFLQGRVVQSFFPANSTFQFCDSVTFVEISKTLFGKTKETLLAKSPNEWMDSLKGSGARGLRLAWKPHNDPKIADRMAAGFVGGGGTWTLEAVGLNDRVAFWLSRWEVWNQNAPDRKIWRVTYGRVGEARIAQLDRADLEELEVELHEALLEIRGFSERNKCGGFTECFARALGALEGKSDHTPAYHRDMAPEGFLVPKAARLLEASQHAWVFGGMGSWNDMGFDGEEQQVYDRVSERLFQTLQECIRAAANSSFDKSKNSEPQMKV